MVNEDLFLQYSNSIKKLRKECLDAGLNEEEFKTLYYDSLKSLEINEEVERNRNMIFIRKIIKMLLALITILYIWWYHKMIYRTIVCNMQEYIYPGLRLLRKLSIPFISLFPALTDYYQETCLIHNPFFAVADMDCWPCSTVNNIRELSDPKLISQQQYAAPFIYQSDQQTISIEILKSMYMKNKNVFDKEAPKILVNNKYYSYPDDMFNEHKDGNKKNLYIWKFNNMNEALILRQIIPRPKVVPKFGQSTERFLIIDSTQDSFKVPDTECNFSFILSLGGQRTIDLIPAEECKHQCKSLRIDLKEAYLLWYNWWYWRPNVLSSSGNSTFVAHIGSYC